MKINGLTADEALKALVSSRQGLSEAEAGRRLSETGPNEISGVAGTPLLARFLSQFTHFLALLLWVGAGCAFLSDYLHPGEGMSMLGAAIIGVILINAVFTFVQEYRAEKALEALKKLLPFTVLVLREGRERRIPSREVVPGDIVVLAEGDRVPADGRLIESAMLRVNNAALTGEAEPQLRNHALSQGELLESTNIVFAGTTVTSGSGRALIFATGMRSEFGRIAHLTSAVESGLSPLQKEIVSATRLVGGIAALVGIFFFVLGFLIGREFWQNFVFAIGITVALIPEGMLPTVTLALAMAGQRMAARKALIKNLASVETLGSVNVICTDKTGTLTQNRMAARKIWSGGGISDASARRQGEDDLLLHCALLCNNARYSEGEYLGDPTETALLRLAREQLGDRDAPRVFEIPFDPDRRRMTTINMLGGREYVFTKGAVEGVLDLCAGFRISGADRPMDSTVRKQTMDAYYSLMDMGLRVLAFAYKARHGSSEMRHESGAEHSSVLADDASPMTHHPSLEEDLVFLGLIGLEDPPRPEVPDAIRKCHEAGIRVIMITGDGSRTALAIAREIRLVRGEPVIVGATEFAQMSDSELRQRLSAPEVIFSRMTPKHKLRIVSILKEEGEYVAVTGDGVNDAPALKKADIGVAMGLTGTDVAKEASDMVLLDDNFATIVSAIEEGRTVYENIRKFITYIFASNIPEAVPYLASILLKIPLPLTIMQILAVDLGTDMLPALALGAEKPTRTVMQRPPRRRTEKLIDASVLVRSYLFLGPLEAVACMFGFFFVLSSAGWQWGRGLAPADPVYLQATTACLTAIVMTQVANVFACRSYRESIFAIGVFSNRLIFAGIAFELCLQLFIVYTPWGNRIFGTHPISAGVWLALAPFALLLLSAEEGRKLLLRRVARTGDGHA
ncbi:MAG: cation-transporting P-type ATPase [Thermodesulfovibrionales bacterium]